MLKILILIGTCAADPSAIRSTKPVTAEATAIVRRMVLTVEPISVCALSPFQTDHANEIAESLSQWEQASRNAPEWSRSQREGFRQRIRKKINEHTLIAVEQLAGPVTVAWLNETYDWNAVDRTSDRTYLEGIPRDETERLFFASLRVSLSVENGAIEQIFVISRNQPALKVWQAENAVTADAIRVVSFDNDVPPSPVKPAVTRRRISSRE